MFTVRRAAGVAAAAVLALGLGACSAKPGTAFVMNGVPYSESDLAAASAQYNAMTGGALASSSLIPIMVNIGAIGAAAEQIGITVTDQEVDAYFSSLVAEGRIQAPEGGSLSPVMREIIRSTVVRQRLASLDEEQAAAMTEAYTQLKDSMELEVSPRYASVDAKGRALAPIFGDVVQGASRAQTLINGEAVPQPTN